MNDFGAAKDNLKTCKRYGILAMLFLVTVINHGDRATLSIASPALSRELGLSAVSMGYIFSAFGWSYVLAQLSGGWLLDRFESKRVYAVSISLVAVISYLFVVGEIKRVVLDKV